MFDSDCADFTQVCIDQRCQAPMTTPDAGTSVDSGAMDGGGSDAGLDGGSTGDGAVPDGAIDGSVDDGGLEDAGDAGPPPCGDPTGAWMVQSIVTAPCGTAAVGNAATVTAGDGACEFMITSDLADALAADGSFTLRSDDTFDPAVSSVSTGGDAAALCNGSLIVGAALSITCGSCQLQLTRP